MRRRILRAARIPDAITRRRSDGSAARREKQIGEGVLCCRSINEYGVAIAFRFRDWVVIAALVWPPALKRAPPTLYALLAMVSRAGGGVIRWPYCRRHCYDGQRGWNYLGLLLGGALSRACVTAERPN